MNSSLNWKLKEKSYYELYLSGARAKTAQIRLQAEADRVYVPESKIYLFVTGWLNELGEYIEDSSLSFQRDSDRDADTSIVGELSVNEMKRRMARIDQERNELTRRFDRLAERLARAEAKGNIIAIRGIRT